MGAGAGEDDEQSASYVKGVGYVIIFIDCNETFLTALRLIGGMRRVQMDGLVAWVGS